MKDKNTVSYIMSSVTYVHILLEIELGISHKTKAKSYLIKFSYNEVKITFIKFFIDKKRRKGRGRFSIKEHISRDTS